MGDGEGNNAGSSVQRCIDPPVISTEVRTMTSSGASNTFFAPPKSEDVRDAGSPPRSGPSYKFSPCPACIYVAGLHGTDLSNENECAKFVSYFCRVFARPDEGVPLNLASYHDRMRFYERIQILAQELAIEGGDISCPSSKSEHSGGSSACGLCE